MIEMKKGYSLKILISLLSFCTFSYWANLALAGELDELIAKASGAESASERLSAVKELSEFSEETATTALIGRLWDQDDAVRLAAAQALDQRGWKPLVRTVEAQYLIAKQDWEKIPQLGESALPLLVKALKLPQWEVRLKVCWVLGEIGDPSAMEYLREAYRHDENPEVRLQAKSAMDKIQLKLVEKEQKQGELPAWIYVFIGTLALILLLLLINLLRRRKKVESA
jgi:HEAT repeat protein